VYPTNNPNWTVKATTWDTGPAVLNTKIHIASSLTKLLSTNSGAVTITLSNSANARAFDNANIHIGEDGSCTFCILGVPSNIDAGGYFSRLSVVGGGEITLNSDRSFPFCTDGFTSPAIQDEL
jgi:hypothetical protein